jgi:hypothetical protein
VIGQKDRWASVFLDAQDTLQSTFMILAVLLSAPALPLVAGAIYQVIGTWQDHRRSPPSGRLVRVNERRMHIHITGEGTPTVVFESGMGASCLSWTLVQPQVAQSTRAVSYHRAGHSGRARRARHSRSQRSYIHCWMQRDCAGHTFSLDTRSGDT